MPPCGRQPQSKNQLQIPRRPSPKTARDSLGMTTKGKAGARKAQAHRSAEKKSSRPFAPLRMTHKKIAARSAGGIRRYENDSE